VRHPLASGCQRRPQGVVAEQAGRIAPPGGGRPPRHEKPGDPSRHLGLPADGASRRRHARPWLRPDCSTPPRSATERDPAGGTGGGTRFETGNTTSRRGRGAPRAPDVERQDPSPTTRKARPGKVVREQRPRLGEVPHALISTPRTRFAATHAIRALCGNPTRDAGRPGARGSRNEARSIPCGRFDRVRSTLGDEPCGDGGRVHQHPSARRHTARCASARGRPEVAMSRIDASARTRASRRRGANRRGRTRTRGRCPRRRAQRRVRIGCVGPRPEAVQVGTCIPSRKPELETSSRTRRAGGGSRRSPPRPRARPRARRRPGVRSRRSESLTNSSTASSHRSSGRPHGDDAVTIPFVATRARRRNRSNCS